MNHQNVTAPTEAFSPDPRRAGPDASPRLAEQFVHIFAWLILFLRARWLGIRPHRSGLPSRFDARPDRPPGSGQSLAALVRDPFGRAIAWMCRRRGIGPGHPDWAELRRAIEAGGGNAHGGRAALPACGQHWWKTPDIIPGTIGVAEPTPATDAMAVLLWPEHFDAPLPTRTVAPAAAEPAVAGAPARPDPCARRA